MKEGTKEKLWECKLNKALKEKLEKPFRKSTNYCCPTINQIEIEGCNIRIFYDTIYKWDDFVRIYKLYTDLCESEFVVDLKYRDRFLFGPSVTLWVPLNQIMEE